MCSVLDLIYTAHPPSIYPESKHSGFPFIDTLSIDRNNLAHYIATTIYTIEYDNHCYKMNHAVNILSRTRPHFFTVGGSQPHDFIDSRNENKLFNDPLKDTDKWIAFRVYMAFYLMFYWIFFFEKRKTNSLLLNIWQEIYKCFAATGDGGIVYPSGQNGYTNLFEQSNHKLYNTNSDRLALWNMWISFVYS